LSEEEQRRAIGSICPNVLFPYARAMVSQLVTQGGFPQFVLPPVNFDSLYAQSVAAAQSQVVKN
jgi:preprotein translocase subunit SecB